MILQVTQSCCLVLLRFYNLPVSGHFMLVLGLINNKGSSFKRLIEAEPLTFQNFN